MQVHECPLENDVLQVNRGNLVVGFAQVVSKRRRWYCINPKHPRLMDDTGVFTACFESECYYLRKVL